MIKIRCIGGMSIDRKLTSQNPWQLHTSNPTSSSLRFGGVAHNVALNLTLLGDNIHLQSIVGEDEAGISIIAHLKKFAIHENLLKTAKYPTARYDALLDQKNELFLALADMEIFEHIPFQEFTQSWAQWEQTDLIFLDTNLDEKLLAHALSTAAQKNIQLCLDCVSVAKAKKLPYSLEGIYLLKADRFEAEALTQTLLKSVDDCIKAGVLLLNKGVKNCIISLGKSGYVLVNEQIQRHFPAFPVNNIVNVSGAGDAFIAGILDQLRQGAPLPQACMMGAAMAALTIQSAHTVNEQINRITLQHFLSQNTLREPYHAAIF